MGVCVSMGVIFVLLIWKALTSFRLCGPQSLVLSCGNLALAGPPAASGHVQPSYTFHRWHFSHLPYTFLHTEMSYMCFILQKAERWEWLSKFTKVSDSSIQFSIRQRNNADMSQNKALFIWELFDTSFLLLRKLSQTLLKMLSLLILINKDLAHYFLPCPLNGFPVVKLSVVFFFSCATWLVGS